MVPDFIDGIYWIGNVGAGYNPIHFSCLDRVHSGFIHSAGRETRRTELAKSGAVFRPNDSARPAGSLFNWEPLLFFYQDIRSPA